MANSPLPKRCCHPTKQVRWVDVDIAGTGMRSAVSFQAVCYCEKCHSTFLSHRKVPKDQRKLMVLVPAIYEMFEKEND